MSKFKVLKGANITDITGLRHEILTLQKQIAKNPRHTYRDYIVYAYHFNRLKSPVNAQKYLNRIPNAYFEHGIYKDLYQALLAWSLINNNSKFKNSKVNRAYEFFIIVQRVVRTFPLLQFKSKKAFMSFTQEFERYNEFMGNYSS